MTKLLICLTLFLGACKSTWKPASKADVQRVSAEVQERVKKQKLEIQKHKSGSYSALARITMYTKGEDRFGTKVASSSKIRASHGRTAAIDPNIIPYGSQIKIPALTKYFGDENWKAEDCGTAVINRKASQGKTMVVDLFVESKSTMRRLMKIIPPYTTVWWKEI